MIEQVDEALCLDWDERLRGSEPAMINHLTWKVRELIDLVNRLQSRIVELEKTSVTEGSS